MLSFSVSVERAENEKECHDDIYLVGRCCVWLLCSWLQPIRTNDIHLSHISFSTKWGRRDRTFFHNGLTEQTHARDKHANKNRLRINARATREAAWRMGPMFVLGGTASDHVPKPSEQPWAALFIPQQRSLLRPGAFCLVQHRDQNKFTASVSKQLSVQKCCCVASIPIA